MRKDYFYKYIRLPFRWILCKCNIHDYECSAANEVGAQLYCFYCLHKKWSRAFPKSKEEADDAYKEWQKIGEPK